MKKIVLALCLLGSSVSVSAETIGQVSTTTNWVGSNDRIVIEAFDDPRIPGVACHLSRAVQGGVTADVGLGTDPTEASIACRQVGPINVNPSSFKQGEEVFNVKQSLLFKTLHVVRFFDTKRNTLAYLVYSNKVINGSPKNSLSTVPIQRW